MVERSAYRSFCSISPSLFQHPRPRQVERRAPRVDPSQSELSSPSISSQLDAVSPLSLRALASHRPEGETEHREDDGSTRECEFDGRDSTLKIVHACSSLLFHHTLFQAIVQADNVSIE